MYAQRAAVYHQAEFDWLWPMNLCAGNDLVEFWKCDESRHWIPILAQTGLASLSRKRLPLFDE
jgi:hypothetical protein